MKQFSEEQYYRLKEKVDQSRIQAERARGALDQLTTQLKKEFDCDNIEEARRLLKEVQAKVKKARDTFNQQMEQYQKRWKSQN